VVIARTCVPGVPAVRSRTLTIQVIDSIVTISQVMDLSCSRPRWKALRIVQHPIREIEKVLSGDPEIQRYQRLPLMAENGR
jgi:hypothetical protein